MHLNQSSMCGFDAPKSKLSLYQDENPALPSFQHCDTSFPTILPVAPFPLLQCQTTTLTLWNTNSLIPGCRRHRLNTCKKGVMASASFFFNCATHASVVVHAS